MKIKYWSFLRIISEIFKCADYRCCFRTNCHGCCSLYNSLCREVSGTTDHPLSSFQEAATMMGKNFGDTWGNFCRFSENLFKTKQAQQSIYTRLWLLSLRVLIQIRWVVQKWRSSPFLYNTSATVTAAARHWLGCPVQVAHFQPCLAWNDGTTVI